MNLSFIINEIKELEDKILLHQNKLSLDENKTNSAAYIYYFASLNNQLDELRKIQTNLLSDGSAGLGDAKSLTGNASAATKIFPDYSHVHVFGDDCKGPIATAIVVGPKAVLACAQSLSTILVSTINEGLENEKQIHKLNENYWIQRRLGKVDGKWVKEDRIPIKLYKYNIENGWAIFVRSDENVFTTYCQIDRSLSTNTARDYNFHKIVLYHVPVSYIVDNMVFSDQFVKCHKAVGHIQDVTSHHVQYNCQGTTSRGSSGGSLHFENSQNVLGLHVENIDYIDIIDDSIEIQHNDKRCRITEKLNLVTVPSSTSNPNKIRKLNNDSETVVSEIHPLFGYGYALIISKCKRLMDYLEQADNQ